MSTSDDAKNPVKYILRPNDSYLDKIKTDEIFYFAQALLNRSKANTNQIVNINQRLQPKQCGPQTSCCRAKSQTPIGGCLPTGSFTRMLRDWPK